MKKNIAINGFGRIGRAITKINQKYDLFNLVFINDINPHLENLSYLFKYDSTYGKFEGDVSVSNNELIINNIRSHCYSYKDLKEIPWENHSVDLLIDSSGVSSNIKDGKKLIKDKKLKKIIVTHSNNDVDKEIIMGVNDSEITSEDEIFSSSICDANALAHIMKWIDEEFIIENGSLTTLHPWLSYQNLVDGSSISFSNPGVIWTDFALGRSSVRNLIPKDTTAMTAVEKILPGLKGKIVSFSYRVPTDIVASSDITLNLKKKIDLKKLNTFLEKKTKESSYIKINKESLVSLDYAKQELSAFIDSQWTKVSGNLIKIVLWYDNEWGYSARVLDLAKKIL